MSNSLAIAAVTSTLRDLLDGVANPLPSDPMSDMDLNDARCSTKPLHEARKDEQANQLNLFLYQTEVNGALRNTDIRGQVRPGETATPPLALDLYYLVTAYGKGADDVLSHRLLGRAMSLLYDHAVLLPADIESSLSGANLHHQVERVRITPHTLTGEELSKLWAIFQTPYRISASYQASVVLIDSSRRTVAPLPVLRRGTVAQSNLTPPFPVLESVRLLNDRPAARLPVQALSGDSVALVGHHLSGTQSRVLLSRALLPEPYELSPATVTSTQLEIDLPNDQTGLPAGPYTAAVVVSPSADPAENLTTNSLPLLIAPRIRVISPQPAVRDSSGEVTVTVQCSPQVWPAQRASLIVGHTEFMAAPHTVTSDTLQFELSGLPAGAATYPVRLRVDGVDSLLIDYAADPLIFDPTQVMDIQ